MKKPLKITILTPCHENWEAMAPAEKGRFCASCQKTVVDFTKASDREIAASFGNGENLCGRFLSSQLERELYIPKEKNTFRIRVAIAVVNIIGLFSYKAMAQQPKKPHRIHINAITERRSSELPVAGRNPISGIVQDADSLTIEGVTIINKNTLEVVKTSSNGKFSIKVCAGDLLEVFSYGYESKKFIFDGENPPVVMLKKEKPQPIFVGGAVISTVTIYKTEPSRRVFSSVIDWLR